MVEVHGLKKRFGKTEALRGVDLSIKEGMIFALVGPDGAGKTTLLRLLAGILTPHDGSINILGHDVVKDPESMKDEIGYLAQRFSLNLVLTVSENIEFFASLFKVPHADRGARIERLLGFSRLGPFKDRKAIQLSGGMKQKLSLCCALIHTPRLLLLDEPTTGVDPISRRELWEILYDLLGEGVTIVFSTPYMDEAERAGELALLHNGRILLTGTPDVLKADYPFILVEVICSQTRKAHELVSSRIGRDRVTLFGDRLHVAVDKTEDADRIRILLQDSGLTVDRIEPVAPSLEDLFIKEISRER